MRFSILLGENGDQLAIEDCNRQSIIFAAAVAHALSKGYSVLSISNLRYGFLKGGRDIFKDMLEDGEGGEKDIYGLPTETAKKVRDSAGPIAVLPVVCRNRFEFGLKLWISTRLYTFFSPMHECLWVRDNLWSLWTSRS